MNYTAANQNEPPINENDIAVSPAARIDGAEKKMPDFIRKQRLAKRKSTGQAFARTPEERAEMRARAAFDYCARRVGDRHPSRTTRTAGRQRHQPEAGSMRGGEGRISAA